MSQHIPAKKKMAIVLACCKLHNYLMPEDGMTSNLIEETASLNSQGDGVLNEEGLPIGLLDGGEHLDDVNVNDINAYGKGLSKRLLLSKQVYDSGMTRPTVNYHRQLKILGHT